MNCRLGNGFCGLSFLTNSSVSRPLLVLTVNSSFQQPLVNNYAQLNLNQFHKTVIFGDGNKMSKNLGEVHLHGCLLERPELSIWRSRATSSIVSLPFIRSSFYFKKSLSQDYVWPPKKEFWAFTRFSLVTSNSSVFDLLTGDKSGITFSIPSL